MVLPSQRPQDNLIYKEVTMKNIYDNKTFFDKYSQMSRSKEGLDGAADWPTLKSLLPNL